MRVSHETIYTYLYVLPRGALKKELLSYLRQQRKHRRKRNNRAKEPDNRGKIPEMISIEERPKEVEKDPCRNTGKATSFSANGNNRL